MSSPLHGRRTVTDFDWLVGQSRKILKWGDRAAQFQPAVHHDYGIHTALKLSALNHAIEVFTPIARKQADSGRRYGRSVYIDLFAGCGVTKTTKGDWLAGSPIIAAHAPAKFDEMILVEKETEKLAALRERVRDVTTVTGSNAVFLDGDCNTLKGQVLGLLQPNDLVFVCIDPEGLEIRWETIRDIVTACPASDLFINFTSGADRVRAVAAATGFGGATLAGFTGKDLADVLRKTGDGSAVLELYEKGLTEELGKSLGVAPRVAAVDGHPRYHVLVRTRMTPRGSPYSSGYQALERRLGGVTAAEAGQAIEIVKNRQTTL